MTPRHSATRAATLCGTAVLGACVVVSLVGFGSPRIESKDTARIDTHHAAFPSADPAPVNPLPATAIAKTEKLGDDVMAPGPSVTETAAWAEPESIIETKAPDAQNIKTAGSGQTQPVIEAVTTDSLHAGQAETLAAQAPEMSPVPMTTAEAPESPHTEAEYAVSALETFDECPVPDICIDQYLLVGVSAHPQARHRQGGGAQESHDQEEGQDANHQQDGYETIGRGLHLEGRKSGGKSQHVAQGLRDRRHGSELQAETLSRAARARRGRS